MSGESKGLMLDREGLGELVMRVNYGGVDLLGMKEQYVDEGQGEAKE